MSNEPNQVTNGEHGNTLREEDLKNFYGTEQWFRHSLFRRYLYTEGVQYVAEHGGAYWLLDKIFGCHEMHAKLQGEDFCSWELIKDEEGNGATLSCTDGNYNPLYSEKIDYTDFPLKEIKFFCVNNVLLLPSEY